MITSATSFRRAIVIGGREEALDFTVLLANAGIAVILAIPEGMEQRTAHLLNQNAEVWESVSSRNLVQIRPIQAMVKEWARCEILVDVRDGSLQEDSLWKAIQGHVAAKTLKLKIASLETSLPEGWSALWWLGPIFAHRHVELQAGSGVAEIWKDLLQRRMGLTTWLTQGPSLCHTMNIRLTRLMLRQLESGANLEVLNLIWAGCFRGAPWFAPENLSSQRIQCCSIGIKTPELWKDSLNKFGVVKRENNAVMVYATKGKYRSPLQPDTSAYKGALALPTLDMRIRQFSKTAGSESKWLWEWLKEMLNICLQVDVPSNVEFDAFWTAQWGWSVGPMTLLDQLGAEWLIQKLKIENEGELIKKLNQRQPLFLKLADRQWQAWQGGQVRQIHLSVYKKQDRPFISAVFENEHASLFDGGDGLGLVMLHGPQNRLTPPTLEILFRSLEWTAQAGGGMVISHEGGHFSAGEDWALLLGLAMEGRYKDLENWLQQSQFLMLQIRQSTVPVVVAAEGLCLGAASSLLSHAHHCCFGSRLGLAFDSSALGLPPTMGVLKEMAMFTGLKSQHEEAHLRSLGTCLEWLVSGQPMWTAAKISSHLLSTPFTIARSPEQRLAFAARQLRWMLESGWSPVVGIEPWPVVGANGLASLEQQLYILKETDRLENDAYDCAKGMARVICGGEQSSTNPMAEEVLLHGERQLFCSQMGKESVRKRLEQVLKGGSHA